MWTAAVSPKNCESRGENIVFVKAIVQVGSPLQNQASSLQTETHSIASRLRQALPATD